MQISMCVKNLHGKVLECRHPQPGTNTPQFMLSDFGKITPPFLITSGLSPLSQVHILIMWRLLMKQTIQSPSPTFQDNPGSIFYIHPRILFTPHGFLLDIRTLTFILTLSSCAGDLSTDESERRGNIPNHRLLLGRDAGIRVYSVPIGRSSFIIFLGQTHEYISAPNQK